MLNQNKQYTNFFPRIVQLTTAHPRNDTRVVVKQCPDLARQWKSDVALAIADGKGSALCSGFQIVDLGKPPLGRLGRALIGGTRGIFYILKIKPDIVHFHDPELIPVGFVCKMMGLKAVYDVHESVPETIMKREWLPRWTRKIVSIVMDGVEKIAGLAFDYIVAATPSIGKRFPKSRTVLVQNFPIKGELTTINSEQYEKRPQEFVYIGGITRERAALEMVQAISSLGFQTNAKLNFVGNFRPVELQKELEKKSGWNSVVFHGWADRTQMAKLLGRVRAGLVLFHPAPNHIDSQPNKLFEYMSAGLPVIASDFPLWRTIVDGVQCGLLVDPQDPNDIAHAMQWILENPEKAKQMGKNGKRAVEETYNWEKESKKLISMYNELIGSRGFKKIA
jgi:glycosyltransferase involved in cell wall biosynthesis